MKGIRKLLLEHLQLDGGWISGGALERIFWRNPKTGNGYKASNVSRRLRELAQEGILESQGNPVEYRVITPA